MEESYLDEISDDGGKKGERVEKGRERNREHAKRTRIKEKAVIDGMKNKLMELQNEVNFMNMAINVSICTADPLCEIKPLIFDQL
jgi:hypothetical protein